MAKKLFSLLMALTLLAALALPAAFAEDYLDIINIADDNQSASYDLHKDTSVNGRNMLRGTVMEQLVTLKADGSIAPELCESYDVSDDNSAFTFHLRKGVKFHNGKEMTSADVVASLNRWLECFGTARKMVGDARFTVVDDYTVSLTLDHSAIMLLDMLAGAAQAAVIYPVESIEAVNADTGYVPADYIIGTGPYMFKEWAVDQYVLLERFDDYAAYGDPDQPIDGLWGYKHAYTKTLKYWIVKDAATRFNGLMSGEYDFIVKATDAYLGTLRSMPDITCYSMQTGMINLVWNKHSTDKYLRLAAEYDNYRKRTTREKENVYGTAKADTIKPFLAVLDNLERGVQQFEEGDGHRQGLEMICKQFIDVLGQMGVTEIPALGQPFDPEKHNAVMHTEDESAGENTIVEVFQKGFMIGDKVLRFAMVKVAN